MKMVTGMGTPDHPYQIQVLCKKVVLFSKALEAAKWQRGKKKKGIDLYRKKMACWW